MHFHHIGGKGMGYRCQDSGMQHHRTGVLGKQCFDNLPLCPWNHAKDCLKRWRRLPYFPWLVGC